MRSKEERRIRHTAAPKVSLTHGTRPSGGEEIVQQGGKIYKKIKVKGQNLYTPLNTTKE